MIWWLSWSDFPGGTVVKNPPANAEDIRDAVSIPGSGRSLGGGNGKLLQYSCLINPLDRGACKLGSMGSQRVGYNWATEHTVVMTMVLTQIDLQKPSFQSHVNIKEFWCILNGIHPTLLSSIVLGVYDPIF